jgi:FkbM family methyltransferase
MYYRDGTNDTFVINAVMESDEYGAKNITYENGDVFIDLGAHIGTWSVLMGIRNPTFKIYSYEPISANLELMKKNLALNKLTNVFPFLLAVSDVSDSIAKIYHNPISNDAFSMAHRFIGNMFSTGNSYYETPTISLNDVFGKNKIGKVRVIKTDCEGCELKAFPSLTPEQLKSIDYVIGEYHAFGMGMEDFYGIFKPYFNRATEPKSNTDLQSFTFKNRELSK